jgi:hypothetical protein
MPGPFDFTGQNISNTYQRVVQVISGSLHDGTGSLFIPLSASYAITASYAVSASHEIVKEISSSYAETASFANNFVVQNSLTASNISASFYYGDGSNLTGIETDPFPYTGSAIISGSVEVTGSSNIIGSGSNPLNTIFSVENSFSSQTNLFNIGEKGDIAFQGGPFSNRFIGGSIYPEMRLWGGQGTIGFDGGSFILRAGKRFAIQHHPGYTEGVRFGTFGGNYYAGFYNQKLGIGTSTPSEKLTIEGNISASGNLIIESNITASGHVSASTYYGDGSNLTGIETDPFPYTGSAIISGSLEVIGEITGSPSFNIHAPNRSTGIKIGNSTTTTVGDRSTAIGVNATANTYDEISIGYNAGAKGSGNPSSAVYIGNNAGNGGAGNGMGKRVGIGHTALGNNNGNSHVAIGDQAGRFGNGSGNVLIGRSAGYDMGGASQNVAIGQNAGNGSVGDGNITLGYYSNGGDGDYNIALGYRAGNMSMTGTNNVLIGYYAGNTFTNESNKLIITNTGSKALITGDFANNTLDISGSVSASTYYGDGSNLTGIETDPFPYTGSAIITGSLTVSGSVVDFTSASSVNLNIDSLPLINPIVEYLDVTASISSGTSITLPNNLSYVSSSVYEYLEVFMNGLRLRYNRDFVPISNTTIQNQMHFPSGSELTFKSLKR